MALSAQRSKRREFSLEAAGLALSTLDKAHAKVLADQYSLIEDLKVEIESTYVDFTAPEGSRITSFRQFSNLKMSGMISNQNLFQLMEFSGLKNSRTLYDLKPVQKADKSPYKIYSITGEPVNRFIRTVRLNNTAANITYDGSTISVKSEAASNATTGFTVYAKGDPIPSGLTVYGQEGATAPYIDPNLAGDGYKVYTMYTVYVDGALSTVDPVIPFADLNKSWTDTIEIGSKNNTRLSGIILEAFNDACQPVGSMAVSNHDVTTISSSSDANIQPPGVDLSGSNTVQISRFRLFGEETRGKTLAEVRAILPIGSSISFGQYANLSKTCDETFSASMIYATTLANGDKVNYEILLPVAKFKTTNIPLGPSAKEQVKTSFEIEVNPIELESLGTDGYLVDDTLFRELAVNTKNPQILIREARVPCTCK